MFNIYKRDHLFIKKVRLSSLNIADMDTNRRMSDLPHGDLETLA